MPLVDTWVVLQSGHTGPHLTSLLWGLAPRLARTLSATYENPRTPFGRQASSR